MRTRELAYNLIQAAEENYKNKKFQASIDDLTKAAKLLDNKSSRVFEILGDAYSQIEKLPQAIKNYTLALSLKDYDSELYLKRGTSFFNSGLINYAYADFEKALEFNPKAIDKLIQFAKDLFAKDLHDKNKIPDALNLVSHLLKCDPSAADAYFLRGFIYHELQQFDKAFVDYVTSTHLGNSDASRTNLLLNQFIPTSSKADLFAWIQMIPDTQLKISTLKEALDKKTNLGCRFWTKEGWTECDLNSGTLKEIKLFLDRLEDFEQKYNSLPTSKIGFFEVKKVDPKTYGKDQNAIFYNNNIFKL